LNAEGAEKSSLTRRFEGREGWGRCWSPCLDVKGWGIGILGGRGNPSPPIRGLIVGGTWGWVGVCGLHGGRCGVGARR